MKLIHIADVHLGARPDASFPWAEKRQAAIRNTFLSAVSDAQRHQADLLLISGDLFHRPPLLKELKEVDSIFSALTHTKVVLIAGNHDFLRENSPLSHYEWKSSVTFLKGESMETVFFPELQTTVYGLSYHSREISAALYDGIHPNKTPGLHILLAHGGDASHIPFDEKRLAQAGFDYVALGHIHIPKIGPGPLGNPGSPEPLDKTETGPHGYLKIRLSQGQREVRFVPAAQFFYDSLSITVTPETTQFLLEKQIQKLLCEKSGACPSPIFLLTVKGKRNADLFFDKASILSLGAIAEVTDETVPDYDLTQLYAEHRHDMLGMYIQNLQAETDAVSRKALYLGIQALLDTSAQ